MEEIKENDLEEILNEDDATIQARVQLCIDQLESLGKSLRSELDESLPENELIESEKFKKWMIINLMVQQAVTNAEYNKLLYFMWEKNNKSIIELVDNYDLDIQRNDENVITNFNLIVKE